MIHTICIICILCLHIFPTSRSKLSILPDQSHIEHLQSLPLCSKWMTISHTPSIYSVDFVPVFLGFFLPRLHSRDAWLVGLACRKKTWTGCICNAVTRCLNLFFRLNIYFSSHLFCRFKCRWGGSHPLRFPRVALGISLALSYITVLDDLIRDRRMGEDMVM